MSKLNALFRERINFPENEKITFETLDDVLIKTAYSVPFENLCIIHNKIPVISKESLVNKLLVNKEGGLCYELNPLLYFFLFENGFNAVLIRAEVYHQETQRFNTLGRTHVAILATHKEQTYLIDTGFGGNLPLKPVPLTGDTMTSMNGQFRIKQEYSEHGDYWFEMKLKHKHTDWRIGYAFDSRKPVTDVSECNEIQKIIFEHQDSPFNKNPLITKLTNRGSITLTDTTFTQWEDGSVTKEKIDNVSFKKLIKYHFNLQ